MTMPHRREAAGFRPRLLALLDSTLSMRRLAAYLHFWARIVFLLRRPRIVGVTGSVGKTTTTEMIAAVLEQPAAFDYVGRADHSRNNLNDDLGVPATLLLFGGLKEEYAPDRLRKALLAPWRALQLVLRLRPYPDLFVLEFGAGWDGHLWRLARLAPPEVAVVTNVGAAHLERFKNLEGVAREKMALVSTVSPAGLAVLGSGHAFVATLAAASAAPVEIVDGKGIELTKNMTRAVCRHLGLPEALIGSGIAAFRPPHGRLNVLEIDGKTVIDDSYNANPMSMRHGLDALAARAGEARRRVALLGFMAELGDEAEEYHRQLGAYARQRADLVVAVGELGRHYHADHWFSRSEDCAQALDELLRPGDCVLIKGSGASAMRRVVERLLGSDKNEAGEEELAPAPALR